MLNRNNSENRLEATTQLRENSPLTQTLIDAILEVGADRILFSVDWPFENVDHAADWFDAATISEGDRLKIGRTNAANLFRLKLASAR